VSQYFTTTLLWFAALGCGLLAGLYFAFSAFVMTALARLEPAHGISAMNSINVVIVRSLFLPFFLGTTFASLVLIVVGLLNRNQPGSTEMMTAGVTYVVGMFVCTMILNVPLNNALAAVDPATPAAASLWTRYLKDWTFWNHVRTICSTVATALYIAAITAR
jgi:uncharacterized membrane protein